MLFDKDRWSSRGDSEWRQGDLPSRGDNHAVQQLRAGFRDFCDERLGTFLDIDAANRHRDSYALWVLKGAGGVDDFLQHHLTIPLVDSGRIDADGRKVGLLARLPDETGRRYAVPIRLLEQLVPHTVPLDLGTWEFFSAPAYITGLYPHQHVRCPQQEVLLSPEAFDEALQHARRTAAGIQTQVKAAPLGMISHVPEGSVILVLLMREAARANTELGLASVLAADDTDLVVSHCLLGVSRLSPPDQQNNFELGVVYVALGGMLGEGQKSLAKPMGPPREQTHTIKVDLNSYGVVSAVSLEPFAERPL